MKPRLFSVIAGIAAGMALIATAPLAQASDRSGVSWSISIGTGSAPVYYAPPPGVYMQPQPVYVQPQPVYVHPQPVYVRPYPVYVAPPPLVVYSGPGYVTYGQSHYREPPRNHGNFRHYDRHSGYGQHGYYGRHHH
jgi:hypothetical protein